jgi:hypothetical protein
MTTIITDPSKENQYYASLISSIYSLIITKGDRITDQQVLELHNEKDRDIQKFRQSGEKLGSWGKWMSYLTFFSLSFSILRSVGFVSLMFTS